MKSMYPHLRCILSHLLNHSRKQVSQSHSPWHHMSHQPPRLLLTHALLTHVVADTHLFDEHLWRTPTTPWEHDTYLGSRLTGRMQPGARLFVSIGSTPLELTWGKYIESRGPRETLVTEYILLGSLGWHLGNMGAGPATTLGLHFGLSSRWA